MEKKFLKFFFLILVIVFLFYPPKSLAEKRIPNLPDKNILKERIKESKNFLLRMENLRENGFYKYYLPYWNKKTEERLHTTYSASIVYSLLFVYEFDKDNKILEKIPQWGNFLLKMQNRKNGTKHYGAFTYSYFFNKKGLPWGSKINSLTIYQNGQKFFNTFYIDEKGRELRYVVGTNAKTIFTLLRLYEYTKDKKYLDSAKLAGDWLLTMQNRDGTIKPYVRYSEGKWYSGTEESFLYEGAVLSAFSRLYAFTGEEKYYSAGKKIADRFVEKIKKAKGDFVKDDYRKKNAISNSWIIMSLLDFYKVSLNQDYKKIIFEHSQKIIKDQIVDEKDLTNFGRYQTVFSSSGAGWVAEVLTEVYRFCLEEGKGIDCQKYKDSVLKAIKWIFQHYYNNPKDLKGGIYWSKSYKHIRTDSVAHSLNSFVRIIEYL